MIQERKYFILSVLLIGVFSLASSQSAAPQINGVAAQSDGTILINWSYNYDNTVEHYEILRSTDINGSFVHIGDAPRGTFRFIDKTDLFKTSSKYFCYKVTAVGANESRTSNSMGVLYNSTSSAAKRTWGSIKAMFR